MISFVSSQIQAEAHQGVFLMRRRRFQKGTLRNKGGSWQLKYSPVPGKATTKTLGRSKGPDKITRSEAERRRTEFIQKLNAGPDERRRAATVREFVETVFFPTKRESGDWRSRTAKDTENRIERYILVVIGDKNWADLEPGDLTGLLRDMRDRMLGAESLKHTASDLKAICKVALAHGYLTRPIHESLKAPQTKQSKRVKLVISGADYRRAWAALTERERLAFDLVMFCGLRASEVYGLQCGDVTEQGLKIQRSSFKGTLNETKTEADRTVGLPAAVLKRLRAWVAALPANEPSAWLFPSTALSTPLDPDNIRKDKIQPALKPLGLAWVNFAVLRRSHSTHHKSVGTDPKLIADQQGHGLGVHMKVYVQPDPAEQAKASEKLYSWINEVNPE